MLETKDLVLDKAKLSDWEEMYHNVWSRPEIAKYTEWRVSTSEDDAKERIIKTIEFQKNTIHILYMRRQAESQSVLQEWKSYRPSYTKKRGFAWDLPIWGRALGNKFYNA